MRHGTSSFVEDVSQWRNVSLLGRLVMPSVSLHYAVAGNPMGGADGSQQFRRRISSVSRPQWSYLELLFLLWRLRCSPEVFLLELSCAVRTRIPRFSIRRNGSRWSLERKRFPMNNGSCIHQLFVPSTWPRAVGCQAGGLRYPSCSRQV